MRVRTPDELEPVGGLRRHVPGAEAPGLRGGDQGGAWGEPEPEHREIPATLPCAPRRMWYTLRSVPKCCKREQKSGGLILSPEGYRAQYRTGTRQSERLRETAVPDCRMDKRCGVIQLPSAPSYNQHKQESHGWLTRPSNSFDRHACTVST